MADNNDEILYWVHAEFPTNVEWAYKNLHAGTVAKMDANPSWVRVTLVPTTDV